MQNKQTNKNMEILVNCTVTVLYNSTKFSDNMIQEIELYGEWGTHFLSLSDTM